jgi:magnesium transporter
MTDQPSITVSPLPDPQSVMVPRQDDGSLDPDYMKFIASAVDGEDHESLKALVAGLHETDMADILQKSDPFRRADFIRLLGDDFDFSALGELDQSVRTSILDDLPNDIIARGVSALDSDDAVYILEDLEPAEQTDILKKIPAFDRIPLQRSLDYPEETAGRRMQSDFIAVPPFWTVGQTIDYMRDTDNLPDQFYEIFVTDPGYKLVGTVSLSKLLRAKRPVPISDLLEPMAHKILATEDQEQAALTFQRYNLVSAAVVDENDRLAGILTIDDIVDVIQEEAEEDIRGLAGVGDEAVSDSLSAITRSRFPWLVINLATAILASVVIGLFGATIEQMVALAILMPIVASMGGNAATQTMTVAVRAIATRSLDKSNMMKVIFRETMVGLINGILFAIMIGVVSALWFSNPQLGFVIAFAMVVNMVAAGLSGIAIPLILQKMKADPAIASGVFVTTVTDVVGFFAFLGFATWWFSLGWGA